MVKQLEDMTEEELWSLKENAATLGELEEIESEITRRDELQQEEVGFEMVDECCDECQWVSQIESERGVK